MGIQRNTVQQQIILDALEKFNTHPTVDEIYEEICKEHPSISKATVYRNLRKLTENGDIRQVTMTDETERYDRRIESHYHFKCKVCKKILDVDIDYNSNVDETVRRIYGFQVDDHDVIFKGVCTQCKIINNKIKIKT